MVSQDDEATVLPRKGFQLWLVKKEFPKKGEVDSMAWQTYAVEKSVVLEKMIQEMVQQKEKLPNQLMKAADVILKTSSRINVIILRLCPSVCMNNIFLVVVKEPQEGFRTTSMGDFNFGGYILAVIHRTKSESQVSFTGLAASQA